MADLVGRNVDGYVLEASIGGDNTGVVYRAIHQQTRQEVAIKVLHRHLTDPGFSARLQDLFLTMRRLSHPNIIPILGHGEIERQSCVITELQAGGSLRGLVEKRPAGERALPIEVVLELAIQAAGALQAAHQLDLLHLNFSPEKLLLTRAGLERSSTPGDFALRIADFGITAILQSSSMTVGGAAVTRPAYMSPEQCQWAPLDGRSDLYSFGVTFFELSTGYLPFDIETLGTAISKHVTAEATSVRSLVPTLPEMWDQILERCLAKRAVDRYPSAAELLTALETLRRTLPDSARAPQPAAATRRGAVQLGSARASDPTMMEASPVEPPGARVRVLNQDGMEVADEPLTAEGLTLGRSADNKIVFESNMVSRYHLKIGWNGRQATLTDLASTSGTFVDQKRITANAVTPWEPSQLVQAGPFWLQLLIPEKEDVASRRGGKDATFAAPSTPAAPPSAVLHAVGGGPASSGNRPPAPSPAPVAGPPAVEPAKTPVPAASPAPAPAAAPVTAAPVAPSPAPATPKPAVAPLRIGMVQDRDSLTLTPGQPALIRLTLKNLGRIVEWPDLAVDGVPAEWVQLPSQQIQLNPDQQTVVPVNVIVPRKATNRAGEYGVTIRVKPADPERAVDSVPVVGRWMVLPFVGAKLSAEPTRAKGRLETRYSLHVANEGNAAGDFRFSAKDEEKALTCRFEPEVVRVEPGGSAATTLHVAAPRHWFGRSQSLGLAVRAESTETGESLATALQFVHLPIIPAWAVPLFLLLLLPLLLLLLKPAPIEPPTIVGFQISPSPVIEQPGATMQVFWDVKGAETVTLAPTSTVLMPASRGTLEVPIPQKETRYSLVARNAGGEVSRDFVVKVEKVLCRVVNGEGALELLNGPGPEYRPALRTLALGDSGVPLARTADARWIEIQMSDSAEKGWVSAGQADLACSTDLKALPLGTIRPLVEFFAEPKAVLPGGTAKIQWNVVNAREVYLDGRRVEASGSQQVKPDAAMTYELRVVRQDGTEDVRQAQVAVGAAPAATPTPPPAPAEPASSQLLTQNVSLEKGKRFYYVQPAKEGPVLVSLRWTGAQKKLAVQIRDPNELKLKDAVKAPSRLFRNVLREGTSPLEATYELDKEALAAKDRFRVAVVDPGNEQAEASISLTWPREAQGTFQENFTFVPEMAVAVIPIILKSHGKIEIQAEWIGTGSDCWLALYAPGRTREVAARLGKSPLKVEYSVSPAEFAQGDIWRIGLVSASGAAISGPVTVRYP